mmetsp:Transcript_31191/g.48263  ORF Transcript_31191/g.48263 Transcript_31191/m.48263 type:complete len:168 (+) Transcript_31191:1090-1593(+)
MVGHISFLVSCTRQNLEFAYAKLSKFVVYPGVKHMCAAERTLQYIMGTYDKRLTYSSLDSRRRNVLEGWVDSDFASDPDTRKSVTGYVMSFNGAPLSWEAKRQGCVTLSSSEAEFVAASQCAVEVLYLQALLEGVGLRQEGPTRVWEDNAACRAATSTLASTACGSW